MGEASQSSDKSTFSIEMKVDSQSTDYGVVNSQELADAFDDMLNDANDTPDFKALREKFTQANKTGAEHDAYVAKLM